MVGPWGLARSRDGQRSGAMEAPWLPRTQLAAPACFCCCLALGRAGHLSLLEAELFPYRRMGTGEDLLTTSTIILLY